VSEPSGVQVLVRRVPKMTTLSPLESESRMFGKLRAIPEAEHLKEAKDNVGIRGGITPSCCQ